MSQSPAVKDPVNFTISGVVDFSTVPDQLRQASAFIAARVKDSENTGEDNPEIAIDLSEVTACNSAALALVLEIAKDAADNNLKIHFNHLPETLLTIAKAYGAESEFREITQ